MANRRHLCLHFPECFIWLCRVWGIFTAVVSWGVGVETAYKKHPLGGYLLVIALVLSVFEVVFIVHFWVVYKAQDERDKCVRVCGAMSLLDNWKKGLLYLCLAPGCFSQPHSVWLAIIPGVALVIAGVLYCVKTFTTQEDAALQEVNKNETYGRFDEVQEDIEENLVETMEAVSPDETTVADQDEIMDL